MRKNFSERGKNTKTLGSAIKQYLRYRGFDKKIAEAKIRKNIDKIIPPKYFPYILEFMIAENNIYIKVESSVVKTELMHLKNQIIERANQIAELNLIKKVIIY